MHATVKSSFSPAGAAQVQERQASAGRRPARRLAAAAMGLCMVAGLALLPSSPALAAPASWLAAAPARAAAAAQPADNFLAVSCPARRMCVAVGIADITQGLLLAERWNGRRWTVTHPPLPAGANSGGLTGVSCSSPRACTAVGFYYGPAVGVGPLAERWNGQGWALQTMPSAGGEGIPLAAVSCPAADSCTAVGQASNTGFDLAEHWNGRRWAIQPTPQVGTTGSALSGVSCLSSSWCTAVGDYEGPPPGQGSPGAAPLALHWNGAKWAVQPTPGTATNGDVSGLAGVSCPSASACTAVGSDATGYPLALRWNGTRWASQKIIGPFALSAVSCWSAGQCIAVGDPGFSGFAERLKGQTWTLRQVRTPAGAHAFYLAGVSCPAPGRCTAVGYQDRTVSQVTDVRTLAERWNGRSWVVQATPSPLR
jgi:hypothetical protein